MRGPIFFVFGTQKTSFLIYSNQPNLTCCAKRDGERIVFVNHGAHFFPCGVGMPSSSIVWYVRINPYVHGEDWRAILNGGAIVAVRSLAIGRLTITSNACAGPHQLGYKCQLSNKTNACLMADEDDAWRVRNAKALIMQQLRWHKGPQRGESGYRVLSERALRLAHGLAARDHSFSSGTLSALDLCHSHPHSQVRLRGFTKHMKSAEVLQRAINHCEDVHRYDLEMQILLRLCPNVMLVNESVC